MQLRYEGVPFFWTSQFGKTIRYAGYASKPDDIVIHGSVSAPLAEVSFTVFYVLGERVAAVATFNRDPQAVAAMELLRLGEMPSPRQLRGVDSLDLQVCLRGGGPRVTSSELQGLAPSRRNTSSNVWLRAPRGQQRLGLVEFRARADGAIRGLGCYLANYGNALAL